MRDVWREQTINEALRDNLLTVIRYSEGSSLERKGTFASEWAVKHRLDPSEYLRMTLNQLSAREASTPAASQFCLLR